MPAVLLADDAVIVIVEPNTMTGVGTVAVLPNVLDVSAHVAPDEPYPLPDEIAVLSVDVFHVDVGAVLVNKKVKVSPSVEARIPPFANHSTAVLNLLYVDVTMTVPLSSEPQPYRFRR